MSRMRAILVILVLGLSVIAPSRIAGAVRQRSTTATQSGSVICGKPTDPGLIVYLDILDTRATPEADGIQTSLEVFQPDGTEVHRLPLSTIPSPLVPVVDCTIAFSGTDLGPVLFDAGTGEIVPLLVSEGFNDLLVPFNGWQRTYHEHRWAVLSDGRLDHVLLVDVRTGHSTDLGTLVHQLRGDESGGGVVFGAQFTPDESSLLLLTDRDTWIVPTADSSRARLVGDAAVGRTALSEDGTRLLYVT